MSGFTRLGLSGTRRVLYTILIVNDQVNEDLKTGGFSALHQR